MKELLIKLSMDKSQKNAKWIKLGTRVHTVLLYIFFNPRKGKICLCGQTTNSSCS